MLPGKKMNNQALIDTVRSYKALWDKQTCEKTELFRRERMWEDVAAKIGSTKPLVKARWKNLRDAYRKLVRKTMRTGQPPRWPYFKSMNFLTLTDVPRDSGTKQGQKIEDISNDADYTTNSDDDPLSLTAQSLKMEKDIKRNSEELPRHFLEVESERASLSLNEQQQQQTVSADDEDYQFLLSLYPHIKQVPLNRKLPLRMKIEQVIYEELYSLPSTSNSTKSIIASYQTE